MTTDGTLMPHELNRLLLGAADDLRLAHRELDDRSRDAAAADQAWRRVRARAYVQTTGTVAERDAEVEILTSDERYRAKLAEDLRVSALEAARSKRAILTASQTLANLSREEMAFARSGPDGGP